MGNHKGDSAIRKSDCKYLLKRMYEVQQETVRYAMDGFPATGFGDAFMLRVKMIELREAIVQILKDNQ